MPSKQSEDTEPRSSQDIEDEITELSNDKEAIRDRQRELHGELAEALERERLDRDAAKTDQDRVLDQATGPAVDRRN